MRMRIPAFIHLPGPAADSPTPWGASMASWLGDRAARLRRWYDEQRTAEEIAKLDRHLLRDIGVEGGMLQARLESERMRAGGRR